MIPSSACPPRHPDQQRPAPNTTATASDSYTTWWDTIDLIKIDRSFISQLATSTYDQKLVRALITMAHDLGYDVVAEGVETRETYDILVYWGCDEAQGYFISRPLPPGEMQPWLHPQMVAPSQAS